MADGNRRYRSDKKLYKVSFKLSEEDKRLLEEGAKKAGMNISEYLRNLSDFLWQKYLFLL